MPRLDQELFADPPKKYRNAPFWSWNDRLEPKELVRQIAIMDEQGWGGFFMHARAGLQTRYLSAEWMECVRVCVEEARRRGMHAWLYDEDRWPSGFAGGVVPAQGPRFRAKTLNCTFNDNRIARFRARIKQGRVVEAQPIQLHHDACTPEDLPAGGCDLTFTVHHAVTGNPMFNGYAYVDWLNPETILAFLDSTHEPYAGLFGSEFGKTVPGIFTDEPMLRLRDTDQTACCIPWTDGLSDTFWATYGYDLLPHLASLFFDVGKNPRLVRYQFWKLVLERFLECFTKPYAEWCDGRGIELTGHVMGEDSLVEQIEAVAAAMPHYACMQRPGIDLLTRSIGLPDEPLLWDPYRPGGVLLAKQCTSVAHQLAKERTISELYGCSGHNLSCEDRRWIGDWHLVHGINTFCPHLSAYSLRGARKRDYPPTLFYQQPYWRHTRPVELYQARLCYALTCGHRITDLLVLHPMGSAWAEYKPRDTGTVETLNEALQWLSLWLCELQRDFDYGDEHVLRQTARVEENTLVVGLCRYRAVLIPPSITWEAVTVELLQQFVQAGGTLLAVPPLPTLAECERSRALEELLKKAIVVPHHKQRLQEALDRVLPAQVRIRDTQGGETPSLWLHHRRDGEREILFVANTDRQQSVDAVISVTGGGAWEEWDALTGTVTECASRARGSQIEVCFAPAQSRLLVCDHRRKPVAAGARRPRKWRAVEPGAWRVERLEPNAFTVDHVCLFDEAVEEWREPEYHVMVQQALRSLQRGQRFAVAYDFTLAFRPEQRRPMAVAIESPERYAITVNGKPYRGKAKGWFRDISFERLDLTGRLVQGVNTIALAGEWEPDLEIEPIYVLGEFSVATRDRKTFVLEKPEALLVRDGCDLTREGLPFYAGDVRLSSRFALPRRKPRRVWLRMERMDAMLVRVFVNGKQAGGIYWHPLELEIGAWVKPGKNRLDLVLSTSLHNLLGPHHCGRELHGVAPESFTDTEHFDPQYTFVPLGVAGVRVEYA